MSLRSKSRGPKTHPGVRLRLESLETREVPAAFTAGNLVVYTVGTGVGSLVNTGNAVFLNEYSTAGAPVQSIAAPTTLVGTNKPLIASGTATSEGLLSLSADGHYLVFTGYGTTLGGAAVLPDTAPAAVPRVVGRVAAAGVIDTTTALSDVGSGAGNNIRSVASSNGTDLWVAGPNGVNYATFGATTSTSLSTINFRQVGVFNNQLYVSSNTGTANTNKGENTVGLGLPMIAGQTVTRLPGLTDTINASDYGFFFADLSATVAGLDTLYVADDDGTVGGILKFTFNGTTWAADGRVGTAADNYRGLTGVVNGTNVTLYSTRKGGSGATGGGELVSLTDASGYDGTIIATPSLLATAAANTAFRGVAFVPTIFAGTPSVSTATTNEDTQSSSGLVITASAIDNGGTTNYKITNIVNGTLFKNNGTTPIVNNDFITKAEGLLGLKFTPSPNLYSSVSNFSFGVQASINATNAGLGGSVTNASITVNPIADTPSVSSALTGANTQTTSGLVITRNLADSTEVTHFQITAITNGTLFQNDGTTAIANGAFITFAQANAGLKFTPTAAFVGSGTFQVQASTSNLAAGLGGSLATGMITVAQMFTPTVSNATTNEDTQSTSGLVITANTGDNNGTTNYQITGITNGLLFKNNGTTPILNGDFITKAEGLAGLKFTPSPNFFGTASFDVQGSTSASAAGLGGGTVTASITVNAVADTPSVTNATTNEDVQTTSGLVISRNAADSAEVTHFKITGITGGTLFQNDGITTINSGDFITFAQGNAGLKFTPTANLFSPGSTFSFNVQASTSNVNAGLGGATVNASITVNPIADTPSVTNATTNEDVQTTSGLVITRNAADSGEVTHFKITSITNGSLFQNNGTTAIVNGDFITFAQGNAGLKFTPSANFFGAASFQAQGSTSATNAGLGGGTVTATITVNPIADTPSVTNSSTTTSTQTTTGLVISRNVADSAEVTHFRVNNYVNGTLFQNDGTTAIASGTFITFAQANAGLKFTPTAAFTGTGSFDVQASTSNVATGLGGAVVTASITVTMPLAPSVTSATTNEDTQTTSGLVITPNAADGGTTTHFKITGITNGTLFKNNGTTAILNNDFITKAEGAAGLKFTPAANFFGTGSFQAQGSTSATNAGLGGGAAATASITVNPVADTPSVTNATTNEDTQTTSGLVITRNAADSAEVTHFKITGITNGSLFLSDGITGITNGTFITFAQGNAGLRFTPNSNLFSAASTFRFDVQASTSNVNAGLSGGVVTATITVNPVADTPSVTNATTNEDTQTTSGLVITRNAVDGAEVTNFQITNISNGTLFLNDGTTAINSGDFITVAQGAAGLKYTPNTDQNNATTAFFDFDVQASTSPSNAGLGGSLNFATITVNAVNDAPTFTATNPPVIDANLPLQTVTRFATFSAGPSTATDETSTQSPLYSVTVAGVTGNLVFTSAPAIDASGTLTYATATDTSGTALIQVTVTDTGSGTSPNVNTSVPQTFTITVNAPVVVTPPTPTPTPPPTPTPTFPTIVIGTDVGAGVVRILNAATGVPVREFVPFQGYTGGVRVAQGDVNGDGKDDIIVSTVSTVGHVKVFDGATGAEIRSFLPFDNYPSGLSVAAGDVDGDGYADIVVGVTNGPTHVEVFSGKDGALLLSFIAYEGFLGGVQVAAGDLNGDGKADIATVAGPGGNGHIKVFDGTDLTVLQSYLAYVNYSGDVNIAIGDVLGGSAIITTAFNSQSGTAIEATLVNGTVVASFFAPNTNATPTGTTFRRATSDTPLPKPARIAASDVTGDGIEDYLLGSAPGSPNQLLVLDGVSHGVIQSLFAFDPTYNLGVYVG